MGLGGDEERCVGGRGLQTHRAAREQIGGRLRCGEGAGVEQLAARGCAVAVEAVCWRGSPFTCARSSRVLAGWPAEDLDVSTDVGGWREAEGAAERL